MCRREKRQHARAAAIRSLNWMATIGSITVQRGLTRCSLFPAARLDRAAASAWSSLVLELVLEKPRHIVGAFLRVEDFAFEADP
jgi:hypothetical protein